MQSLICVARVDGPFAVALVVAKLRGAGIWSHVDIFHTATNYCHYAVALGGAKVMVLEQDVQAAADLLEDGPPITSSGLHGWRAVVAVLLFFQCGAGPSPFAVYLQREPVRAKVVQTA